VRLARLAAPWTVVCLLGLAAGCAGPNLIRPSATPQAPADTWIVTRDPAVARAVTAPTAPALVARLDAASPAATMLPADKTRIAVTSVGPIASIDRTKSYTIPTGTLDLAVSFTPAATPPRQDYVVHVGGRAFTILVRERLEAQDLARTQPNAHLVPTDGAGVVTVPVGNHPRARSICASRRPASCRGAKARTSSSCRACPTATSRSTRRSSARARSSW
jgi:hypothetical protein